MANHTLYVSARWRRLRARVLRKYKYEDQEARRYGKVVTATMVHHIYPVTDYPELAFIEWNLLPLSFVSHNTMHDRITDELTERGKYWKTKREPEYREWLARQRS